MGGFYQWVEDPSTNPTWGGLFGGGASEAGQNILGSSGSLSSEWWGFPGGQWGPEGFSIPWYAPMPSQSDPWWNSPLGQSLYEMVFGIPYGIGGGNTQDLPAPPADVTPQLPGEETAPPVEEAAPPVEDPSLPGYSDEPGSPGMPENPIPIDVPITIPTDPTIPIGVGAGIGSGIIGGIIGSGGSGDPGTGSYPDPVTGDPTFPIEHAENARLEAKPERTGVPWFQGQGIGWLPTDPTPMPGWEDPGWTPPTDLGQPIEVPQLPPAEIPTIPSPIPGALDPTTPTTPDTPTPSIPDLSGLQVGSGGGPFAAPVDAHAGAPKNLQSLMQLPASVVQQIPRLGALLAGLR